MPRRSVLRVRAILAFALAATASAACGGSSYEGSGSAPCRPVLASDYDQSCVVDTDCLTVGQVSQCPATACDSCATEAINQSAMAQYMSAFAQAFATSPRPGFCGCPCTVNGICRAGKCQAGYCEPGPADTLPACTDAGGQCDYAANTSCNGIGPPDSCAYSDEVCCLN
jgi:hypothetical protein